MKINTVSNQEIEVSDSFTELTFNIRSEDMGFVLDILRSKMYKNPIEAICREITSNSRDANREAGRKSVPIEISFEEDFMGDNICLVISDSGVGISEERMGDVFINYGASTKRNTNTQTGGFGLGAKTPFSYTDNFSISTVVNGIKYNYVAVIEQNSNGKILLINQEECQDRNGTKIYIPIKNCDRRDFEYSILKNTLLWEVRPIYTNFEYFDPSNYVNIEIERHTEFTIVKTNDNYYNKFYRNSVYLLIDDIPYDLDLSIADLSCYGICTNCAYFLNFKTGMLSISATRENIHYEKETIKKIQSRYKVFIDYITKLLTDEINLCTNYIEAVCTVRKFNEDSKYNDFIKFVKKSEILNFSWNGQFLSWTCYRTDFRYFRIIRIDKFNNKKFVDSFDMTMLKTKWYFLDRMYIDEGRASSIKSDCVYIIEPIDKRTLKFSKLPYSMKKDLVITIRHMQNELEKLKEYGINYEMFSSIEPIKIKREKKTKVSVKYVNGAYFSFENCSSDLSDITEGYYIVRDYRNETQADKNQFDTYRKIINYCKVRCYVFGKTMEPKIKNTKLKNFVSELPSIFSEEIGLKKLINRKYISEHVSNVTDYRSFDDELSTLNKLDFDSDVKNSIQKIYNIVTSNDYSFGEISNDIIDEYMKYYTVDNETQAIDDDLNKIKEIWNKFTLIKYVLNTYNRISQEAIDELNFYIKHKNISLINGGSI